MVGDHNITFVQNFRPLGAVDAYISYNGVVSQGARRGKGGKEKKRKEKKRTFGDLQSCFTTKNRNEDEPKIYDFLKTKHYPKNKDKLKMKMNLNIKTISYINMSFIKRLIEM